MKRCIELPSFLNLSQEIGSRLCAEALWSGELCNWIGDSLSYEPSGWQVVRRPLGPNLYTGASGIALFLAYLFRCVPDQNFRKTAEGAMSYALSGLDKLRSAGNFGFYSGLTGLAYVLSQMAEIFASPQFADRSLAILRDLPPIPANLQP